MDTLISCHKALERTASTAIQSLEQVEQLRTLLFLSQRRVEMASILLAEHLEVCSIQIPDKSGTLLNKANISFWQILVAKSTSLTLAASVCILQSQFDSWMHFLKMAPIERDGGEWSGSASQWSI